MMKSFEFLFYFYFCFWVWFLSLVSLTKILVGIMCVCASVGACERPKDTIPGGCLDFCKIGGSKFLRNN